MDIFTVTLEDGKSLSGNCWTKEGNAKAIVIHTGMDEHASRYEGLALYLNEAGIDVYVLDAEGQGTNAKSVEDQQKWTEGAFERSVDCMAKKLNELKAEGKEVFVMGHSMGSFITQRFIQKYPDVASKAIICGSNGPNAKGLMKLGSTVAKMVVTKKNWDKPSGLLQNLGLGGYAKAVKDRKTDFDWLSYDEDNVQKYIADPYCGHVNTNGFWKVFLASMAHLWDKKEMEKINKDLKVFIIAGDADPVGENGKGPKALNKAYLELGIKGTSLKVYEHMRHEILNEKEKATVMEDIRSFLLA